MFAPINHYSYEKHSHKHIFAPPGNTNVAVPGSEFFIIQRSKGFLVINGWSDPNLQDGYLRGMLEQIDQLANEDIEMQVSSRTDEVLSFDFKFQAPLSEFAIFLIVDTNIFLHHFEVLTQFVEDIERLSLPVIVIVPGAVIYELDGYVYQIDAMYSG
jgi:hypothetical protein